MPAAEASRVTQLRALYDALHALEQAEQTTLAELHADKPGKLRRRVSNDLLTVGGYPAPRSPGLVGSKRKMLPVDVDVDDIRFTVQFASVAKEGRIVFEEGAAPFTYVDRELVPLRQIGGFAPLSMDLLLRAADGVPVLAELKLAKDNLPYYALIQLLMHAVELSSEAQRGRLSAAAATAGAKVASTGSLDLSLITYGASHKSFGERSGKATRAIAKALMKSDEPLRALARSLSWLHAEPDGDVLRLREVFRFD